ncbi:MAG TPA: hypothetical protein VEY89_04965 [Candidatus Dormibacteraeota bacterium]|nr:hypothetical protein [Candidatus Dormibacteraeota bacterium]
MLVFVALVLPIVLLPAAAFAMDAAAAAAGHARLEADTTVAAEAAVQQIDAALLRAGAGPALDQAAVEAVVRQVVTSDEPGATVDRVTVDGLYVTVEASRSVALPLNFLGAPSIQVRASATAHLVLGYESPSSFLPFPVSTF